MCNCARTLPLSCHQVINQKITLVDYFSYITATDHARLLRRSVYGLKATDIP